MVCRIGLRAEGRLWSENVAGLEKETKLDIHGSSQRCREIKQESTKLSFDKIFCLPLG